MFTLTVGCLVPGVVAGMRRDIPSHEKWMIRFYGSMYVHLVPRDRETGRHKRGIKRQRERRRLDRPRERETERERHTHTKI